MAGPPAGRRGHAQHRARVVGQRAPGAGSGPRAGCAAAGRPRRRGGQQLLGEERRCPRSARAGARRARGRRRRRGSPRPARASSARREGLELDALRPARGAPPRPGTGAADGGGAARRCGRCRRAAGARRAGRAAARRGTRASSGRPSAGPRPRSSDGQLGGQPVEQPAQQPEQAGLGERVAGGVVAIVGAAGPRAQLGQEPRQLGAAPARRASSKAAGSSSRASRAQRRGDRRVGQLAGAEGRALAAQHARPAIHGAPLELAQQPRLADARLAGSRTLRPPTPRAARSSAASSSASSAARPTNSGWRRAVAHGDYLRASPGRERAHARRSRRLRSSTGLVASTVTLVTPYFSAAARARGERKR